MSRLIQWFINNPIATNLLVVLILVAGGMSTLSLNKEVFPAIQLNQVHISVPYPSAGPQEVEEQIIKRIEEAIGDLEGIKQIESTARMNLGLVVAEAADDQDLQTLLNEIKNRVDSITTFPSSVEEPRIFKLRAENQIMSIALYGDVNERLLKQTGERLRDDIALLPGNVKVELRGTRADELSVEISQENLLRYNLSFEQIAMAIRASSVNVPAGLIESETGDIQLQTRGQAYTAEDFGDIVIRRNQDGSKLLVRDVAGVIDGFESSTVISSINGDPAVFITVTSSEAPDVIRSSRVIKKYLKEAKNNLPPGLDISIWRDFSDTFNSRLKLLTSNAVMGLILVFVVLMLFLRPALAAWVSFGIGIALLGAVWAMPLLNVSLNMVSMFTFLMVLGILVDDAIIVGESIYSHQQKEPRGHVAAAQGAKAVARPVLFAVISTMIFFAPLLNVPGFMGDVTYAIPVIVLLALTFSLIESLLILPSHLSHMQPEKEGKGLSRSLKQIRERFSAGLEFVAARYYQPTLSYCLNNKSVTLIGFFLAFALSVAIYGGGWVRSAFMPLVASDYIRAQIIIPEGSSEDAVQDTLTRITTATQWLEDNHPAFEEPIIAGIRTTVQDNNIAVTLGLKDSRDKTISATEIGKSWRRAMGDLPLAESIDVNATINTRTADIMLRFTSINTDRAFMETAVNTIVEEIARYPGVYDAKSNLATRRTEIELSLKPEAETLGLTLGDIAQQVRQGFYGFEAQRIPRDREDVRVMVRYTESERNQADQLEKMRLRLSDGAEVPLTTVADIHYRPSPSVIERIDRRRAILISAEVEPGTSDADQIVAAVLSEKLMGWQQQYPGISLGIDGDMADRAVFMSTVGRNFILAILVTFGLMAIAFRSYWQPMLILTAIPFGFMGAVIGHLIMGREISMMSILGFFACAGVVVNDNLVLLDRINNLRQHGGELLDAVKQAGIDRFRAIILTSITTFIGLMPIMAETSTQARFLIPIVISLSFGVLFATTVTLILVPTLYLTLEEINTKIAGFKGGNSHPEEAHDNSALERS